MNLNLRFYWSLLLRRLPVMLALFLICAVVGGVIAYKLPETYTTQARLAVEAPQIDNTRYENAAEKLDSIRERVLRRANMIDIATRYDVIEDRVSMEPDDVVDHMRSNTYILNSSGRGKADIMIIGFSGRTGKIAADVVNEYVTLVLELDKTRGLTEAEARLRFYEQQVNRYSTELEQRSTAIVVFKNENACCLPDDLIYRTGRLTTLQERKTRLERDLASLKGRREEVKAVFAATGSVGNTQRQLSADEQELQALEREYERLKVIYSPTNPRLRTIENQIAAMRNQMLAASSSETVGKQLDPQQALLEVTLADLDAQIVIQVSDLEGTLDEISKLENSIARTATNAISLDTLDRDRKNVQQLYDTAVRNMGQAREEVQIEIDRKGQEIRVIENASVPTTPSGPNRKRAILMGLAAGLGLAGGYFMLLEVLNRSIRRPAEIRSKFGIIPIATIPYMETHRQRVMRRGLLVVSFIAVLVGVPALLWGIDQFYMPLDILASKVLDKLGVS